MITVMQEAVSLVDPHDCTDSKAARSVHEALFDALVRRDEQLRYVPGIAVSWQVSDDARVWTFRLREGVRFHDGSVCDADAVVYSIERMARPDVGATLGAPAVYAQYLAGVEVVAVDAQTVRVTLEQPLADLLDILVDGYIIPPREIDHRTAPVGTGRYRLAAWEPGSRLVVEAHDAHFDGQPRWRRVWWEAVPELEERLAALQAGQADIVAGLDAAAGRVVEADRTARVARVRGSTCVVYLLNCFDGPLVDARVRRALHLALDRKEIVERVVDGAGYPLASFGGVHHLGYDPDVAPLPYDPEEARRQVAGAGHGDGLRLELLSPTSLPDEAAALAHVVTEQLGRVGVEVDITFVPDRVAYATMVRQKEIRDLCCFDSSPLSTFRVLREKLSSVQRGSWWQGYDSPELNELLALASRTPDDAGRAALYRRCYRLVQDDAPWFFLYDPQHIFAIGGAAGGWGPRADGLVVV